MTDIQNSVTIGEVLEYAVYMQNNKYNYTLSELYFAKEFIFEKCNEIRELKKDINLNY